MDGEAFTMGKRNPSMIMALAAWPKYQKHKSTPQNHGYIGLHFNNIPLHVVLIIRGVYHSRGPVHIVTGSAGCKEGRDRFKHTPFPWSAFRSQDYGYTKFKAFNKTHIYMEQISVDRRGQAIDALWLVKDKGLRFH